MLTLYLTRHGETQWNIERRLQGSKDSPLTERGLNQAKNLRDRLKSENIDVIYASPTKRALDTAKIIAEANDTPIVVCDDFKEVGFGEYEGKYIKDLPMIGNNNFLEEMFCGNHEIKLVNGETLLDVKARTFKKLESILKEDENKTILIVTHGMALKVIMSYFAQFEKELKGVYGQASLTKINIDKDEFDILFKNDRSHTEKL